MFYDPKFGQTLTLASEVGELPLDSTINPLLLDVSLHPLPQEDDPSTPNISTLPLLPMGEGNNEEEEFQVLEVVGSGGMGVVVLAQQNTLRRKVAIKRPHPGKLDSNRMQALVREGILTGQLEHPNIVPVHFLGRTEEGHPALVMKRISGTSWKDLIHDEEHPGWSNIQGDRLGWHLRVLIQVANAVEFAHSQGVLHRDIKPGNVMLGDFGEVYLLDWGIGLKLSQEGAVTPSTFAGTPSYMAPEMLGGTLSPQTDIYLLGATLHEILTSKARHSGESIEEVIWQARHSKPYNYPNHIPQELAALCNQATALEPNTRFPNVAAFRKAIEIHLEHRSALSLAETAQSRLHELEAKVELGWSTISTEERLQLHEIATECRFALRESLKRWPEYTKARDQLRQCTELMVHIELTLGNLSSAELLLAELDEIPEHWTERLAQLRAEQESNSLAKERLLSMEHNLDQRVGSTGRSWLMAVLASLIVLTATTYAILSGDLFVTTPQGAFGTGLALVTMSAIIAYLYRGVLLQTELNRNLTSIYFAGCTGVLLSRSIAFFVPTSLAATFMVDMIVMGMGFAIATLTVEPKLFLSPIIFLAGIVATAIWPSWSYVILCVASVFGILWISVVWQKIEEGYTAPGTSFKGDGSKSNPPFRAQASPLKEHNNSLP